MNQLTLAVGACCAVPTTPQVVHPEKYFTCIAVRIKRRFAACAHFLLPSLLAGSRLVPGAAANARLVGHQLVCFLTRPARGTVCNALAGS
jgi:hypothetical protein